MSLFTGDPVKCKATGTENNSGTPGLCDCEAEDKEIPQEDNVVTAPPRRSRFRYQVEEKGLFRRK